METRLTADSSARRLIEALVTCGVDTFFGVPGGPICPIFDAIRVTPGTHLVDSRHETHAAFAAATYYRSSGRVPAVVVTSGPGITNVVTGIASASLERVPMLVIAGDVAWMSTGQRLAQDSGPEGIDAEALLRPITRMQVRAHSSQGVVGRVLAALECAKDPIHMGPVLFVLPLDVATQPCSVPEIVRPARRCLVVDPPVDSVKHTARLLFDAKHPLIVLGAGCRGHEAAVSRLVDIANVPFVTTPRAKGVVSEQHSHSLRNGGMAASLWARRYTAEPVDVCLALGTDLDDTSMGPTPFIGQGGKLVHVDLNAYIFGRNVPTALGVVADIKAFVDALYDEIRSKKSRTTCDAMHAAKAASPFDRPDAVADDTFPIQPHRLIADLEAAVEPDARFVTDIGEHMLFALHYLTATTPDAFYVQLNLGSMGSGIAGAIGLGLADRARQVVCIAGDGGMHMAGMEALVALRERLPILFVVFNDGRYNMVHHGMCQIFGDASQYDMPPVDFAVWASSFGMPATVVTKPGEICRSLVDKLLSAGGPALIDARIDPSCRIRGGGRVEALQQMSMTGGGT